MLIPAVLALCGCGYVHFGRLPPTITTIVGDEQLLKENSDLRVEKKMLEQELAIARAQGDALRMAIENRAADGETSKQLIARLNESTRELALLRASYVELKTSRGGAAAAGDDAVELQTKLAAVEQSLSASRRTHAILQKEVARLRDDVAQARDENSALTSQVKTITAQNEDARAALAQLNTELLAQKEARGQAEADAETFRTELQAVAPNSSALARYRLGAASEARLLAPEPATNSSALKHQLDLLQSKVEALESDRAKFNAAAAAVLAGSAAGPTAQARSGPQPVSTSAAPSPAGVTRSPTVVAEASRIDLGASSASEDTGATARAAGPAGAGSVNATLVTSAASRVGAGRREAADERTHIVASGDTLAKISIAYYGTPARWGDILSANRDALGEENKLIVGRTLRIP